MNIGEPLRALGAVDHAALRDAVQALDEDAWREDAQRQQDFDVHRQTESVVLVFCKLDRWPALDVEKRAGWDRLAELAVPIMHDLIARHYPPGGTVIRAMAAKLLSGGKIAPHTDSHPSFHAGHRIHVPLTTNPRVRFMIDGRPYRLQPGQAYELNNQLTHSVMNKGAEDRVSFIFDYLPPAVLGRQAAGA